MKTILLGVTVVAASLLQGCAWLTGMDDQRRVDVALADDRACRREGHAWPGEAYLECRRLRHDAEQRERWQELQMSRQQQQPQVGIQPLSPVEPYRPVREENFECVDARTDDGEPYIACRENDAGR